MTDLKNGSWQVKLTWLQTHNPRLMSIMRYFEYRHLAPGLREVSKRVHDVAWDMVEQGLPDSAELTTGLRKLLEAKDCFVRAALPG